MGKCRAVGWKKGAGMFDSFLVERYLTGLNFILENNKQSVLLKVFVNKFPELMSSPTEEWNKVHSSGFCIPLGHVLISGPEMVSMGNPCFN